MLSNYLQGKIIMRLFHLVPLQQPAAFWKSYEMELGKTSEQEVSPAQGAHAWIYS